MPGPLAWPPTKEDLERLYLFEKLSAAKIARAYGLKYKNQKVAESTILHQLKKNGIRRRDSADHVRKVTPEMVDRWVKRYRAGESLKGIAGGELSPVTVLLHLRKRGVQSRDKIDAQIQAVTKHKRKPFVGDKLDRAYLIGMRCGDLFAVRHGRAIRVKVSTTHPAMINLFRGLFSAYGPIYQYPKKSELTGYEWCLDCDLDETFEFLLDPRKELEEIMSSVELFAAFLAGFFDADGSVYYHRKGAHGGFEFSLTNTDQALLRQVSDELSRNGFSPRLHVDRQTPSRGVTRGGERIGRLSLWRYQEVCRVLRMMPIRHEEKLAKRKLALILAYRASRPDRQALIAQWDELIGNIRKGRDFCIKNAETAFLDGRRTLNRAKTTPFIKRS